MELPVVMMTVCGATSRMMMKVGGASSQMMKVCGATMSNSNCPCSNR